ncbi:MAG: chemotaxis protein CheW [Calditrichaeota bacterium]|nr:chemotaxis protein CheW [Calditrichota bacterium]MCB0294182.1 chemotaxis protein CheW [Calditrichota bacterium]MCB0305102.1 chemotaxis protein CheW [Calditrichota bacterium]MCB0316873.1 chemotaxis protein CheW [Calditrichota bacterium]MCB9088457.1 chemotaxis protein CheW [Calditrichia bacterium]
MAIENGRTAQEMERLSIFELGGKLFGLDILNSREVISLPNYTPLPNSADIFSGVFHLRGEIYPLVDVSPVLGLPPKKIQPDDMVILLDDMSDFVIGMLVDKIHSVLPFLPAEQKMPRGIVSKQMESFVKGVLYYHQDKQQVVHILDLNSLFRAKQLVAHY